MCSYCGCESEPLIQSLTEDHAAIAHQVYRMGQCLDFGEGVQATDALGEVAWRLWPHSLAEEAGLFSELVAARQQLEPHQRQRPVGFAGRRLT